MTKETKVPRLARKLAERLLPGEVEAFLDALYGPSDYAPCVLWTHGSAPDPHPFETRERPPWMPPWIDPLAGGQRPGQSPLQDSGDIYILDQSSVAMASDLAAVPAARRILDVCSAPGGKGIMAWRRFQPEELICNEVLGKRLGMLGFNLDRCRIEPSRMISRDPRDLSEALTGACDLVIVDAPCSGQSMAAKGKESGGGFHPAAVNANSNRQKRILACAAPCVAPGGFLAYMTCTFSPEENEEPIRWLLKRFPEFEPVEAACHPDLRNSIDELPSIRIWPHRGQGAGGFACLLRRRADGGRTEPDFDLLSRWTKSRRRPDRDPGPSIEA
ncbi:MAG: RsmB/NOP family class I SAM-dependent RNA methyltransferase [Fimbriimonadaceae bacterium]|nr:RsmB/NOP family class I SAM-dependent RNA methyltransferase [Fimbriimonadaceae bacterium]